MANSEHFRENLEFEETLRSKVEASLYLPNEVITNDDVEDWSIRFEGEDPITAEGLTKRTGIERRFVARDQTSLDMGLKAVEGLSSNHKTPDLFLFSSSYPIGINQAESVEKEFGSSANNNLEIGAACSGFTVGLSKLKEHKEDLNGADVLFVAGEKYSDTCLDLRFNSPEDDYSLAQLLFSDGAAAVRFRLGEDLNILHAESYENITDDILMPIDESKRAGNYLGLHVPNSPDHFRQNGTNVLKIVSRELPPLINKAVEESGLTPEDIKMVIPHQPSQQVLRSLSKRAPEYKFVADFYDGNFSSASIPKALSEVLKGKEMNFAYQNEFGSEEMGINRGDKVVLAGFGAGMHANVTVVEF